MWNVGIIVISLLCRHSVATLSLNATLVLGLLTGISACRPAIDDNGLSAEVSSSELTDGSVTTSKIKDGAVTPAKLSIAYLPLSGGTLTGALSLAGGAPTDSTHACTKGYADGYVGGQSIYSLGTITNGQVLAWSSANSRWQPTTVAGGGAATSIIGKAVATVNTTAPTSTGQTLTYNLGNDEWEIGTVATGSIANSAITSAKINDGEIVNADISATAAIAVSKLNGTGTSGQVLTTDGTAAGASWATPGGVISGGTSGYLTKYTAATTIGNSVLFESSGAVGLGTTTPDSKITVSANAAALPAALTGSLLHLGNTNATNSVVQVDSFAAEGSLAFERANTTALAPSALASADSLGNISFYGYGASQYLANPGAKINAVATQTWTNAAGGTALTFSTRANGAITAPTEAMRIDQTGYVGIGTTSPGSKLEVNGSIKASSTDPRLVLNNSAAGGQSWQMMSTTLATNGVADGSLGIWDDTAGVFRFAISPSGNVGIGTSSPILAVNANTRAVHAYQNTTNGAGYRAQSSNSNLEILAGNGKNYIWSDTATSLGIYTNSTEQITIDTNGYVTLASGRLTSAAADGNLMLNAAGARPVYLNYSGGTGGVQVCDGAGGSGTIYAASFVASDRKLKTKIERIENPLDIIEQINGVRFNWKNPKKSAQRQVGVIAQDVQKVLPELVHEGPLKHLTVSYEGLAAPLIEAVKALHARVKDLFEKFSKHSQEIESLKAENAALKKYLCAKDPGASICK